MLWASSPPRKKTQRTNCKMCCLGDQFVTWLAVLTLTLITMVDKAFGAFLPSAFQYMKSHLEINQKPNWQTSFMKIILEYVLRNNTSGISLFSIFQFDYPVLFIIFLNLACFTVHCGSPTFPSVGISPLVTVIISLWLESFYSIWFILTELMCSAKGSRLWQH